MKAVCIIPVLCLSALLPMSGATPAIGGTGGSGRSSGDDCESSGQYKVIDNAELLKTTINLQRSATELGFADCYFYEVFGPLEEWWDDGFGDNHDLFRWAMKEWLSDESVDLTYQNFIESVFGPLIGWDITNIDSDFLKWAIPLYDNNRESQTDIIDAIGPLETWWPIVGFGDDFEFFMWIFDYSDGINLYGRELDLTKVFGDVDKWWQHPFNDALVEWAFDYVGRSTFQNAFGDMDQWDVADVVNPTAVFKNIFEKYGSMPAYEDDIKDLALIFQMELLQFDVDLVKWAFTFLEEGTFSTIKDIFGDVKDWDTSGVADTNALFKNIFSEYASISTYVDDVKGLVKSLQIVLDNELFRFAFDKHFAIGNSKGNNYRQAVVDIFGNFDEWDTSAVAMDNEVLRFAVDRYFTDNLDGRNGIINVFGAFESWDISDVTNMDDLFLTAGGSEDIDVFGMTSWNTSAVTSMRCTFCCANTFTVSIYGELLWDTKNVLDMSGMFKGAFLEYMPAFSDISNVEDMSEMFSGVSLLALASSSKEDNTDDPDLCWPTVGRRLASGIMAADNMFFESELYFDPCCVDRDLHGTLGSPDPGYCQVQATFDGALRQNVPDALAGTGGGQLHVVGTSDGKDRVTALSFDVKDWLDPYNNLSGETAYIRLQIKNIGGDYIGLKNLRVKLASDGSQDFVETSTYNDIAMFDPSDSGHRFAISTTDFAFFDVKELLDVAFAQNAGGLLGPNRFNLNLYVEVGEPYVGTYYFYSNEGVATQVDATAMYPPTLVWGLDYGTQSA